MMKNIVRVVLFLLAAAPHLALSQQTMPIFVSRLTARAEGASVRLTWQDPDETIAGLLVYRSVVEITTDTFGEATLIGRAVSGDMTFVDHPPDTTPYYYGVAVADEQGIPSTVFVPFRNKTTTATAIDAESLLASQPAEITALRASTVGNEIVLSFDTSSSRRDISVYRSTRPILSTQDILASVLIDTIPSSDREFRDTPVAGLDYYYALFDTEILRTGRQEFVPRRNVLSDAVRLPSAEETAEPFSTTPVRSRPLPFLVLDSRLDTGAALSGPGRNTEAPGEVISPELIAAVRRVVPETTSSRAPIESPIYLPEDRLTTNPSAQSEIAVVIAELFSQEAWSAAREALEAYLFTRRPPETYARAKYYLAQTLYFEQRYREAFIEFLYASDRYYAAATPWLDNILRLLSSEQKG
jgi:hypothetical protein